MFGHGEIWNALTSLARRFNDHEARLSALEDRAALKQQKDVKMARSIDEIKALLHRNTDLQHALIQSYNELADRVRQADQTGEDLDDLAQEIEDNSEALAAAVTHGTNFSPSGNTGGTSTPPATPAT
jgi:chromosome segregation ATPase